MSSSRQKIGKQGEDLAAQYLEEQGWQILERNRKFKGAEIDIIALDRDIIVFVEVRTRTTDDWGTALESITEKKLSSLRSGVVQWLLDQNEYFKARIDAVTVKISNGQVELQHHRSIG